MMAQALMRYLAIIVGIFCLLAAPVAAQKALSDHGFAITAITLETPSGERLSLIVEVASTHEERAKGLMHRQVLTDSEGMLFIWPDRGVRQFWMKNTPLSLDILFFEGQGTLVHLAEAQTPYSEELISSLMPVRYVLELPAGDAARLGLAIGTRLIQFP